MHSHERVAHRHDDGWTNIKAATESTEAQARSTNPEQANAACLGWARAVAAPPRGRICPGWDSCAQRARGASSSAASPSAADWFALRAKRRTNAQNSDECGENAMRKKLRTCRALDCACCRGGRGVAAKKAAQHDARDNAVRHTVKGRRRNGERAHDSWPPHVISDWPVCSGIHPSAHGTGGWPCAQK